MFQRKRVLLRPVYVTLPLGVSPNGSGILVGNPVFAGSVIVPLASFGTRLSGAGTPCVDHLSSARNSARCVTDDDSGFWNCWQFPRLLPAPVPCCMLDMK